MKTCKHCSRPLIFIRMDALYCSTMCRMKAARLRRSAMRRRTRKGRTCALDGCDTALDDNRAGAHYCSRRCKQLARQRRMNAGQEVMVERDFTVDELAEINLTPVEASMLVNCGRNVFVFPPRKKPNLPEWLITVEHPQVVHEWFDHLQSVRSLFPGTKGADDVARLIKILMPLISCNTSENGKIVKVGADFIKNRDALAEEHRLKTLWQDYHEATAHDKERDKAMRRLARLGLIHIGTFAYQASSKLNRVISRTELGDKLVKRLHDRVHGIAADIAWVAPYA